MNRATIEGSSNIKEIGYDPENMTMEIKFHNGQIYQYWPITQLGWELLMKTKSKGDYFVRNYRKNPKINYKEVTEIQSGD